MFQVFGVNMVNYLKGKYKINDFIIQNEVYKKAEGNPVLLNKIIKRKPINFETGIRKCIEYAKKSN